MKCIYLMISMLLFASVTMAQDLFQEASIDNVTRRTGGERYEISLNNPVNTLTFTLEAELVNASDNAHKIQIYSVTYMTISGQVRSVVGEQFLTGANAKLILNMSSSDPISKVIVQAESWRAYHGLFISMEGTISRTTEPDVTYPELLDFSNHPPFSLYTRFVFALQLFSKLQRQCLFLLGPAVLLPLLVVSRPHQ